MYYGTPPIVTNGLMLHLDTLNPQSIPLYPTVNNVLAQSSSFRSSYAAATCSISWSQADTSWYLTFKSGSTATNYKGIMASVGPSYYVLEPTSSRVTYSFKAQAITANLPMSIDINNSPYSGSNPSNDNRITAQDVYFPASQFIVTTSSIQNVYVQYTVQTGSADFTGSYYYCWTNFIVQNGTVIDQDLTVRCWDFQHELMNFQTPFTPTSRSVWYDLSGNGFHAKLTGSARPIPQFTAPTENTLYFDGTGSYAQIPDGTFTNFGSGDFTFSTWIRRETNASGFIFGSQTANTFFTYFGTGGFFTYGRGGVALDNTFTNTNFSANQWFHIAFIKSNNTMSLYNNGMLMQQQPNTSSYVQGTSNFIIGKNPSSPITWFQGKLANYMVYNRALSQQELLQNFNATKGRFGL